MPALELMIFMTASLSSRSALRELSSLDRARVAPFRAPGRRRMSSTMRRIMTASTPPSTSVWNAVALKTSFTSLPKDELLRLTLYIPEMYIAFSVRLLGTSLPLSWTKAMPYRSRRNGTSFQGSSRTWRRKWSRR